MTQKPTEQEIQEALELLEKTSPDEASRENAIKTVESMKKIASVLVDRVDKDLESGKVTVSDDGKITRNN